MLTFIVFLYHAGIFKICYKNKTKGTLINISSIVGQLGLVICQVMLQAKEL